MILRFWRGVCWILGHDPADARSDLRVDTYCQRCGRRLATRPTWVAVTETLTIAIRGVTAAMTIALDPSIRKAIKAAADFNTAMARIEAITGKGDAERPTRS